MPTAKDKKDPVRKGKRGPAPGHGYHPRTLDAEQMAKDINAYVDTHELPLICSIISDLDYFCRESLYRLAKENHNLANSIKRANEKAQATIAQRAITGRYNPSVAIFCLKNYGWTDQPQVEAQDNSGTLGDFLKQCAEDDEDE